MAIDDSFKKPGAVPFKWEIRPGVPKVQHQNPPPPADHHRSFIPEEKHQHQEVEQYGDHSLSSPSTPQKLRPPPAGYYFRPPLELRTRSFLSAPRIRSERHRLERSVFSRPDIAVSQGCFLTPMLWRKTGKKRTHKPKPEFESEPGYSSDLETLSRWSVSSRKSFSPFHDSPSSSSFSSYRSSPQPVSDAEWAGFGLF